MLFVQHLASYPPVEAKLRAFRHGKKIEEEKHCCGMAQVHQSGLGYDDLDSLMNGPVPLRFTMEVVSVEEPGQHRLEAWAMNDEQKKAVLPQLREEGTYCKRCYIINFLAERPKNIFSGSLICVAYNSTHSKQA